MFLSFVPIGKMSGLKQKETVSWGFLKSKGSGGIPGKFWRIRIDREAGKGHGRMGDTPLFE